MDSTSKEVVQELPGRIKIYKDGSIERLFGSPYVPPSPQPDPETGVSSKDITISTNPLISARLYLPKLTQSIEQKVPILVYFHGGAFCLESAFSLFYTTLLNALVSEAKVIAVSVEYRLAPEHPLPAAYEDCWSALQWVASKKDPWLLNHGDFDRLYIGDDSAGGNIVHNLTLQAGSQGLNGDVKILGGFLSHPYFWLYRTDYDKSMPSLIWEFVYPSAVEGVDDAFINPFGDGKPSLMGLGCSKLLVCVAEKDLLRDIGVMYYNAVEESGWNGEIEVYESKGEDHCFHIFNFGTENSRIMIKRLASFLN